MRIFVSYERERESDHGPSQDRVLMHQAAGANINITACIRSHSMLQTAYEREIKRGGGGEI